MTTVETGAGIESERARCRHCAGAIYRAKLASTPPWRHTDTGLTTCVDLTGRDRRARPTRQHEEAQAGG